MLLALQSSMANLVKSLDLAQLEQFVLAGLWKEKEELIEAVYDRYLQLTGNAVEQSCFGTQDFWDAVVSYLSGDDDAS